MPWIRWAHVQDILSVAQALTFISGISRSGITIIARLFCGLKRLWAAKYSFLVAVLTILADSLFQVVNAMCGAGLDEAGLGPMLVRWELWPFPALWR
jgi:undecaprenyl pyrophosphate phosphatase UppP